MPKMWARRNNLDMRKIGLARVLGAILGLLATSPAQAQHADRIFVDGKVWTAVDGHLPAQAFAVRGDRILAVGSNAEMRALIGPTTAVVDLHGKLVVPGFNDAHWHFQSAESADLADTADVTEIQARLMAFAESHPKATWITGNGWGYAAFPGKVPHRKYLDSVFPDRPVVIWERDGHMCLANSKALGLAGVTKDTKDPEYGRLEREANGDLTGELKEAAVELVASHIPEPDAEARYQALRRTLEQAASYGLTSLQSASQGWGDDIPALDRVLAEGNLKTRFYVALALKKHPTNDDLHDDVALKDRYRGPLLKFGSVKGFVDGTVDAKTAVMVEPFVGGGNGIANFTQNELNQAVAAYDRVGLQVMLHAIGDKAIHMALDAYENAAKVNGVRDRRDRVEHVEVPLLADLPRFKQLGVIAVTQPLFANPDETTLNNFAVLLGPDRAAHADSFQIFDDAGAVQAFGSDHPVFSMEVLKSIYCAVTRMTPQGTPKGGWYPEGRVSVEAALKHFTRDAAYASFDDDVKGTITPGKLADFVVLSDDILTGPAEKILQTKVLMTVMGGQPTYRAGEFE